MQSPPKLEVADSSRPASCLPPLPIAKTEQPSNAIVVYTAPLVKQEQHLEQRIIDNNVPVRLTNTSGSLAGSGSGSADFHQVSQAITIGETSSTSLPSKDTIVPLEEDTARHDWSRYSRVSFVDDKHISYRCLMKNQYVTEYRLRGSFCLVSDWWNLIRGKPHFARIRGIIETTPFAPFVSLPFGNSDRLLIIALVERWWDTTHTFHFPCGEIGITPLDFTMLTGMSVGIGKTIPFDEALETWTVMHDYFPRLAPDCFDTKGIKFSAFSHHYIAATENNSLQPEANSEEEKEYVRAFLLYFVGQCLFNGGHSCVRLGYLSGLLDVEKIWDYDWGGAALCHLYRGLDRATRTTAVKGQVVGIHPILEVWFYEYVASLNAILDDVHDHDSWPRMRAWCSDNRIKEFHETHHNIHLSRQQIEIRSLESIRWRPWERSRHMRDGIVQFAATLSRYRVILATHDHKAYYLGDRCWRQVTGEIAVPCDPPTNMLSSKDIPDETVDYHRANGWIDASNFLDYEVDYPEYWHRVSIGPLLPAVYRAGNIDMIGRDGIRPELHVPRPASPQSHPRAYDSFVTVPPPQGEKSEWYYTVMGSQGCDQYIPIPSIDDTRLAELQSNIADLPIDMLRAQYIDSLRMVEGLRTSIYRVTTEMQRERREDQERARLAEEQHRRESARLKMELQRVSEQLHQLGEEQPQSSRKRGRRRRIH